MTTCSNCTICGEPVGQDDDVQHDLEGGMAHSACVYALDDDYEDDRALSEGPER